MLNVKDYGAKGDGIVNDTTSVNHAIDQARMNVRGEVIYFPSGIYILDSVLNFDGRSISFLGDGKSHTILQWTGKPGGISLSGGGASGDNIAVFSVSGLTLATSQLGGGTALRLAYSAAGPNPTKKTRIHDVEIRGKDQSPAGAPNAWNRGIWITRPAGLDISHTDVWGSRDVTDFGLLCETVKAGEGGIRFFLSNLYFVACQTAIQFSGPSGLEGVYFNNFEIVGCITGFVSAGQATVYKLSNGHIDCMRTGAAFTSTNEVAVYGITFFHSGRDNRKDSGNLITLDTCARVTVSGNTFQGFRNDGLSANISQNGVNIHKCSGGLIVGNHFDGIKDVDILVSGGSNDVRDYLNRNDDTNRPIRKDLP